MLQPFKFIVSTVASFCLIIIFISQYLWPISTSISSSGQDLINQTNSSNSQETLSETTDWSRFAYVQYVTNLPYLCNSVMLFERLHAFGAKADRLLLYPQTLSPDFDNESGFLLRKARDEYNVILKPIEVQSKNSSDSTWAESFTKLLAFNQTEYERVLHIDSDSTVLQSMDELFLLPAAIAAMPRSYWEAQEPHLKLSSQLLLATPSAHEFARCEAAIEAAGPSEYDMEIVNTLYRDVALVLPHKTYDFFTGELRSGPNHTDYFGGDASAVWNVDEAVGRAKMLHFSDWPTPKPWIEPSQAEWDHGLPPCFGGEGQQLDSEEERKGEDLCRERQVWADFHREFRRRRVQVCGVGI